MNATISTANYIVWDTDKTAHGPVELATLISWVRGGRVVAGTWVFASKGGIWERAANLPELQWLFQVHRPNLGAHADPLHAVPGIDASALRRNRLLSHFTDEQLERFTQFVVAERLPQAAVVVKQGDRSNAMYLILEGELSVHLNLGDQETELAILGAGDFFGDFALFDNGRRSADVVANRSCLLLKLSADAFQQLSREAPDLAMPFLRAIGKTLTARIRAGNKHHGEAVMMAQAL
jgi:hypothetical protein